MTQFAKSLETEPDASILTKAIRPLGTIHLTLGVMSLASDDRIKAAIDLLNSLSPPPPPAFTISLRGLHAMRQAKWTSSLYAVPKDDEEGTLYSFCEKLRERFAEEGFVVPETRPLRLHATVLNTLYAPKVDVKLRARGNGSGSDVEDEKVEREEVVGEGRLEGEQSKLEDGKALVDAGEVGQEGETKPEARKRRRKWPLKFDARELVKKYENFEWVKESRIEKVAICEMGAMRVEDEGRDGVERLGLGEEYKETASVPLP
ncbi:MAG: hypothetical protein LQ342_004590 [Letrouitia transgressa]|nr:MAG: hypothetical protein LQ342_004590 [Letrouitia transgressa]